MYRCNGKLNKIKKAAFIYLTQDSGEYYITDDPGYNVQRRPQLGLQYLSAVLEKRGIKTDIFDQTVSPFDSDWVIKKLKGYDIAGFYCSDSQEDKVKSFCKKIKNELNIPVLVGGPSTLTNSTFLNYGCDMVVHGEGETTIQQIIEYYNGERRLEDVKGISYKEDNRVIETIPQELIKNIDDLPFPDRSKVDIDSYYDYFLFRMKRPYITMMASRGCSYRCAFCSACKIWNYKYRTRSVDNVVREIDEVVEKYNVKYIAFQDDVFGITNNWIEEFCRKIINRTYKIRWMAIFHPFAVRHDTERILRLMRKAGCDTLSFGLQSADPRILKNINRDHNEPEQLTRVLKTANKLDFVTAVGYIFGLPGETRETIQTTIDYSLSCNSTLANFYILSILRGSEIEQLYKNRKACELSEEEIERLTVYASKKFYTKPATIFKIFYFIIRNPEWLIKAGIRLPSIVGRLGFVKTRNRIPVRVSHNYNGDYMKCFICLLRRYFYIIFLRRYIEGNVKKRKGGCKICGCCGRTRYVLGRHQIVCKYFDKKRDLCLLWEEKGFDALPYACKIYPFDEKDKCCYSKTCGYYWE